MKQLTILCLLALVARDSLRADWPQFRGADGSGVSAERNLPTRWSSTTGIQWEVALPGRANSSPAVTRDRIDITTQTVDQSLWIISLDRRTGTMRHKIKLGHGAVSATGAPHLYEHRQNAATPSPVADHEYVWAFFGSGLLVCVHAESGTTLWQRDLVREYGPYNITFGMSSSPRLWGNLLIITCLTKGPSYVVAFEKLTGREVWKITRRYLDADDHPDAYSTPTIWHTDGPTQLLVSGAGFLDAYDIMTGTRRWSCAGLEIDSPFGRVIASPTTGSGVIVASGPNPTGGGNGRMLGIRNGQRIWTHAHATPDSSTPVIYDGAVYLVSESGVATCLDVSTGRRLWQKRLGGGPYHASLVAGDGKVYCLGLDGVCTVIQAGRRGRVLSRNALPGTFYATPAISHGTLYLRAYEKLYAVADLP